MAGRGKGTPCSICQREEAGRTWPGSHTWGPSPRANHRMTDSSAEGALPQLPNKAARGPPSTFPPQEEVGAVKWDLRKSTPS